MSTTLAAGKRGELRLLLEARNGRTVIKDSYCRAPLKVSKPFYLEPATGELFLFQMNPGGGMVQGDDYTQEIELEPAARVFITTQASNKIYKTPLGDVRQRNKFVIGRRALFEYFPRANVPFAGSRFLSETIVDLSAGSTAFLSEILTPGRIGSDEVFGYDLYHSRLKVFWERELVLWDNQILTPVEGDLRALGILEGRTHLANFYVFSEAVDQGLADELHAGLRGKVLASASLTLKNGIAVRMLGNRVIDLETAVSKCWNSARRRLLGLAPPRTRSIS